jgi:hypothetical protein
LTRLQHRKADIDRYYAPRANLLSHHIGAAPGTARQVDDHAVGRMQVLLQVLLFNLGCDEPSPISCHYADKPGSGFPFVNLDDLISELDIRLEISW